MSYKYEEDDILMEDALTAYSNLGSNSSNYFKNKKVIRYKRTYYHLLKSTDQLSINKRIDNIVLNNHFNNFKLNKNNKDDPKENYVNNKKEYDEQLEKQFVENYYRVKNYELFNAIYK